VGWIFIKYGWDYTKCEPRSSRMDLKHFRMCAADGIVKLRGMPQSAESIKVNNTKLRTTDTLGVGLLPRSVPTCLPAP